MCRRMLCRGGSRERGLRGLLGGRCRDLLPRWICGGLGGRAIFVSVSILLVFRESRAVGTGGNTLNAALYGIPIGKLAKIASSLFAIGERKARLWEISWIARKRFWFAVAPIR